MGSSKEEILKSCYDRSNTGLGSSKNYKKFAEASGMRSLRSNENPHFYNWNIVWIKYCDGSTHRGNLDQGV
jgi:hypothetical protein